MMLKTHIQVIGLLKGALKSPLLGYIGKGEERRKKKLLSEAADQGNLPLVQECGALSPGLGTVRRLFELAAGAR